MTVNQPAYLVLNTGPQHRLYLDETHDWTSRPHLAKQFPTRQRARAAAQRAHRIPGDRVSVKPDPICPRRLPLVSMFARLFGG